MKNRMVLLIALIALSAFSLSNANAAPFLPDFNAATFVTGAPVDHPYFPLTSSATRVFVGREEPGGEILERFELTNLGPGPTILGVQTSTQQDLAFEGELLVERTFDYYAQDTAGNVWYFGEDVTNFIYDTAGNLIETNNESAWRAGVNDALPGYIMPADVTIGFNYYQEFAPNDQAVDEGTTFSVGGTLSIGGGDFTNVLQVFESTALDPEARGFKYFAPGIGLIFEEEGVDGNFENPDFIFEVVPEPSTLALMGLASVIFRGISYRRNRLRRRVQ